MPSKIKTGNQLSAVQRLALKQNLLKEGWSQNGYKKWEHPFYPERRENLGYTLHSAALKQGIINY